MWHRRRVLVTGGASFVGSHLVDALLRKGACVRVADDLSSGRLSNLEYRLDKIDQKRYVYENLEVQIGDLKDRSFTRNVMKDIDVLFHLAASHGGRGYIESHPAECASNMILDGIVFEEAQKTEVERICYASSACVYPTTLQDQIVDSSETSDLLLSEDMANPFAPGRANADLEYGWAKLMGEMSLRAYNKEYGTKCSVCRIFTAYGERENETHAIIALIAKAFIKMDPYEIWGTGEQDRNFTYVKDIVDGLILASEKITDGSPVNLGTENHIKIKDVATKIFDFIGWRPRKLVFNTSKPMGVFSRAADLTLARKVLQWEPSVSFDEGLGRTVKWYIQTHDTTSVANNLQILLLER
jgi:nucleoside-diphosphate-sugar epimerase